MIVKQLSDKDARHEYDIDAEGDDISGWYVLGEDYWEGPYGTSDEAMEGLNNQWHSWTAEAERAEGTPEADALWQKVADIEANLPEEHRGY